MADALIRDFARAPIGRYADALKEVRAIALGHPLGMSGARLAMTAVSALEVRGGKRAVATMCIGVGQGIAALIERV